MKNIVKIVYSRTRFGSRISVNGEHFDTLMIENKDITEWSAPIRTANRTWDGIFEELKKAAGSDKYVIKFAGDKNAMKVLAKERPKFVRIVPDKNQYDDESEDDRTARILYEELAEAGSAAAQYNLGSYYDHKAFGNIESCMTYYEKAFFWIKKAAEQGHAKAQRAMHNFYTLGICVDRDEKTAREWLKKAIDNDEEIARYYAKYPEWDDLTENIRKKIEQEQTKRVNGMLAELYCKIYCEHRPVYESEMNTLKKCSENGNAFAKFILGEMFLEGEVAEKNVEEAVKLFKESADLGYESSEYKFGTLLCEGEHIKQDKELGLEYIKRAADKNFLPAMNAIAEEYCRQQDYKNMLYYLEKAAKTGNSAATRRIGQMYYDGVYFKKNHKTAEKYFLKADELEKKEAELYS